MSDETTTTTPTATPAEGTKKAAAKKPKYDTDQLQKLANKIHDQVGGDVQQLISQLKIEHKMKLTTGATGQTIVNMAGIKASATAGERMALRNWGNAARRKIKDMAA